MIKRIGLLTSGGDCAGLNAVIRAVVLRAVETYGWRVIGIRQGTHGLLVSPADAVELDLDTLPSGLLRMGGTFLGTTNTGDPFAYPMPDGSKKDRSGEVIANYHRLKLDALIGVGGDGSIAILRRLAQQGDIKLVAIPKTIDNDVGQTETSIGYSTAVDVATEALDRLQPTAASHSRVMILEVMGRDAGHIALATGIAGGADVVLIPEIPWELGKVQNRIEQLKARGRNFALIVVAEAVKTETGEMATMKLAGGTRYGGIGQHLSQVIEKATGAETRVTVLGHVQRGGQPGARDRVLASSFGVHAVDLVAAGKFDRMVAWWHREITDVPIERAIESPHTVDPQGPMVRTARGLGICFGD